MKRLIFVALLVVIMLTTLVTPALAGPPPDAGKGTVNNDGLWNAFLRLLEVGNKTGYYFPYAVVGWLYYWQAGPPPWFAPANYK